MNSLEQMEGIEPVDSGVAHRRVSATLHLLGDLATNEIWFLNQRWRPQARSGDSRVSWVGIEPTSKATSSKESHVRL